MEPTETVARDSAIPFMTAEALLQHWQGHRRLTRRVIEAFPEDQLFTFSVAGMRSFGALALEILAMTAPTVTGVVTGEWRPLSDQSARPHVSCCEHGTRPRRNSIACGHLFLLGDSATP